MKRQLLSIAAAVSALVAGGQAFAQSSSNYSIPWFTFGAGGGTSTAGPYTAFGTIGTFESVTVAAGPYLLVSGFWSDGEETPQPAGPKLFISHARGRLIISWESCGILEEADAVTGPWTTINGATSPYSVTIGPDKKFYRLRACDGK